MLERHIQVGQGDGEPDDVPSMLGEADQVRDDDRLQLLGQVVDLRLGEGDESPIALPSLIVERFD